MSRRFAFHLVLAVLVGVVGAALLHLIIVLLLPQFSDRDAYTRVLAEGEVQRFWRLGEKPDKAGLAKDDPYLETAVCAFDLSESPARIAGANPGIPFWSLAVYDSGSNEVFSINDRTSVAGALDVVLATPMQMTQLRKTLPTGATQSILVESQTSDGYVVLRALAPGRSFAESVSEFLDKATCAPFEWRSRSRF
ncbi:DUF1254 domain-containing protein [Neorhizobium lilium]|uniref:DUF1254 domain-containing protein n=1 Tax=Neorhizobium lilium TaxID=2503024 RepID=A0A444LE10_9HYPH|nr:DUF1254 domain-containing protein [Neorhizobium lilium]RWX76039.1 DUF1254 domain-containing protein [Neorhizobium lilium]